ncbi:MAG: Ig-like domain-containing protein [Acidobacteriota bacterium]
MGFRKKNLTRFIALWLCLSLMLTLLAGFGVALAEDPPPFRTVDAVYLSEWAVTLNIGDAPVRVTCTIVPSNATNQEVIWSSANSSIASVENGVITPHNRGDTYITVTTVDRGLSSDCRVTVIDPTIHVDNVTLSQNSLHMIANGNPVQLTCTVSPNAATNKEIIWSSDNPSVAMVVGGLVTPKSGGTANIRASATDNGKSDTCSVNVDGAGVPVTGLSLNKSSTVLDVGNSEALMATVIPDTANNKNISWSSNNNTIASVNGSGVVTAKAPGTATITATANDGGYAKSCEVTVGGIVLNKNSLSLAANASEKLSATVLGAAGKVVQWSSDNPAIALVGSDGTVTGQKSGSTTIKAKIEGTETYASCSVSVFIRAVGVSLSKTSVELHKYGKSSTIIATISPTEASANVAWRSENTSIASVDGGVVAPYGIGTTKIYATVTNSDGTKVDSLPCTVSVLAPVAPTSIEIVPTSTTVQLNRTTSLRAVVLPEDADQRVVWSSEDSSVVSVSSGVLTGRKLGKTQITVKALDSSCTKSREITVEPVKVTGVRLSSERIDLSTGSRPGRLTCTVEPSDATNRNVYWNVADTSHTITFSSATGAVSVNHAGEATIYVKTEDGGYEAHCWVIVDDYISGSGYWSSDTSGLSSFPGLPELQQSTTNGTSSTSSTTNNSTANPITIPSEPVVQKPSVSGFTDMSGNWADGTVKTLVSKGVMKGYADGSFKPNKSMTRFEFIVALCRSVGLKEDNQKKITYSDAKTIPVWAKGYVAAAYKAGIIPGVWGKQIQGNNAVTRAEASYMVAKALKAQISTKLKALFKDKIPVWAEPYVAFAVQKGLVNGYPDKTFKPAKALTRAEASNILNNLIKTKK